MARIDISRMDRRDKGQNRVHEEANATYTVFIDSGRKYFQIDTYGKASRSHPERISRMLQIDAESAKKLIEILNREMLQ